MIRPSLVKVGTWECAYSKEMFQEEGLIILPICGLQELTILLECSFTVPKGGCEGGGRCNPATLEVRKERAEISC